MQTEQAINSGKPIILKPRKALNKAFLKVKPNRTQIEQFKEAIETIFLYLKKENHAADTSSLEAEIDQLVYKLYGLIEEEIELVEGTIK